MEFVKKYYAATPGGTAGGGGGNPGQNAANDANDAAEQLKESVAVLRDAFLTLGAQIKRDVVENLRNADRATKELGKSLGQQVKTSLESIGKDSQLILSNSVALESGSLKYATVQKQIAEQAKKQLKTEADLLILRNRGDLTAQKYLKLLKQVQDAFREQREELELQSYQALKMEKTVGSLGKIFKGLTKIPVVSQLIDAEKVLGKMQEAAAQGASKWKTFGVGITETFSSIGKSLTSFPVLIGGLVTGFTKLVKLAAEYQSKQFEAAKDLGVSVERGERLRNNFVALARANASLGVVADDLQKSYAGVQNELGIIVKQSNEFNLTSTLIERRTGATAASMAQLQFAAKAMNVPLTQAYQSIVGAAKETGARVKLEMSEKQILEGLAQTSGIIYQNFNGNFKAIAAANVEAKSLGVTLEKIDATQDQFLDFETSIAKQFEAEVLTGKELNLTRARQLALNHDTLGLMREITSQIGTQAEWNKMDTITQKAKAEALGMSRQAVAQMYMDQQKTNLLGKEAGADLQTQYNLLIEQGKTRAQIADILGKEATQTAYTASVSEKLAATMDMIKKSIAEASTKLLPMVDGIVTFLANTENLKKVFIAIAGVLGTIAGTSIALRVAEQQKTNSVIQQLAIQTQLKRLELERLGMAPAQIAAAQGEAVARVTAGSGYLGPGAIGVGLAAGAALAAITGIALAGSGGGAPNVGAAGTTDLTGGTEMTRPINPAVAATTAASSTATTAGAVASTGTARESGNIYLDKEKVGYVLFGRNPVYGLNAT